MSQRERAIATIMGTVSANSAPVDMAHALNSIRGILDAPEPGDNVRDLGHDENNRNAKWAELYTGIIKEAFTVSGVIIGHHLTFVQYTVVDGFPYHIPQEIASADTLIFDHDVAQKIWGIYYEEALKSLALMPVKYRDGELSILYMSRPEYHPAPQF
jgi:hypothetical protein